MSRTFKTADYAATLETQVRLGECLPSEHLARFVVDMVGLLDLSAIYGRYGAKGGQPYDPRLLLGMISYGYLTGVFSSRKLERASYESIPMRYIAGNLHPDHDTLASFRRTFLAEIEEALVQVLLVAQQVGVLAAELDVVSQDGSKVHADASKSQAVSYKRLLALEPRLRAEVAALLALAEQAEQQEVPADLVVEQEVALREARLAQLAVAKAVLEARAAERDAAEQAEYAAKLAERAAKEQRTGKKPGGTPPAAPTPGPRDTDQFNFTDPDSRIMKNGTDQGFDQHYNVQAVVEQQSMLVVAATLSNHPNDQAEVAPTLDAIPLVLGTPTAAALDAGYFSAANIAACADRGIEPSIAPGRDAHRQTLADLLAPAPVPPPETASPRMQMAYKLTTPQGKAIYRARKCTVEPVIGIIKEVMGFRQFSLRGLAAAAGEWCLVCFAYNLKRLHALLSGVLPSLALAQAAQRAAASASDLLQATGQAVVWRIGLVFAPVLHALHPAACQHPLPRSIPRTTAFGLLFSPTGC
jgi:transposase